MTILEELAESARERVKAAKAAVSAQEIRRRESRGFPSYANVRKRPRQKGLFLPISPICISQRSMKRQGRTAYPYSPNPAVFWEAANI